jgi:hypothetical protein
MSPKQNFALKTWNCFSHCIPAEDLLPKRKHTRSWDEEKEEKAYSTPGK